MDGYIRKAIPFGVAAGAGIVDGVVLSKVPNFGPVKSYVAYRAALPVAAYLLDHFRVIPIAEAETLAISGTALLGSEIGHMLYSLVAPSP